ncbi:MAG: hypothetical protein ACREE0_07420 [Phenylobacterium sp.]
MATLVQLLHGWEPAATVGSAIFTAVAAGAAAVGAWEARKSAKEALATRLQSAEPYLRVLIGDPDFRFSWRPSTGEPPRMIQAYTVPAPSHPSIEIANYGGGPALDLRVRINSADDRIAQSFDVPHPGVARGSRLTIYADRFEASAPETAGGVSPILWEQTDFEPACGADQTVRFYLREGLAARLLALTMELEQNGQGQMTGSAQARWNVRIECQTALAKPITFDQVIYATSGRIQQSGQDRETGEWLEKSYWFTLAVEPPHGLEITPGRVIPLALPPPPIVVNVDTGFHA